MVRMIIEGVGIDPARQPVVVLKEQGSNRTLPIWIGPAEARAIELEMRGVKPERPLSHDLLLAAIHMAHAKVLRVIVNDLQESTFFATIDVETPQGVQHVDSRPSDAIALAVRADCPVFIDGNVEEALSEMITEEEQTDVENLDSVEDEELRRFKRLLGEE